VSPSKAIITMTSTDESRVDKSYLELNSYAT
jgi:hypothetical protein